MVFIDQESNVSLYLKDVFPLQSGIMENVVRAEIVLLEHIYLEIIANQEINVAMDKFGTQTFFNAYAQKILDGMEINA